MSPSVPIVRRVPKTTGVTVGRVLLFLGVLVVLSGCGYFVADNPVCAYECHVANSEQFGRGE